MSDRRLAIKKGGGNSTSVKKVHVVIVAEVQEGRLR